MTNNTDRIINFYLKKLDYTAVLTAANSAKKNTISIINIVDNHDGEGNGDCDLSGSFDVTLAFGNFSNEMKRYIRSNDNVIEVHFGQITNDRSRFSQYRTMEGRPIENVRNIKKYPSHCFIKRYQFNVNLDDLNGLTTRTINIPKDCFAYFLDMRGEDCPYMSRKRSKTVMSNPLDVWPYIIFTSVFRYKWEPSPDSKPKKSPYIINSDKIKSYFSYIPVYSTNDKLIYDDVYYQVSTLRNTIEWIKIGDNHFRSNNKNLNYTDSGIIITAKENINIDLTVSSESECDCLRIKKEGDHNYTSYSGDDQITIQLQANKYVCIFYHKDVSDSVNNDCAEITGIQVRN